MLKNYRAGWKTGTPLASDFLCNDAEKLLIAMGGGGSPRFNCKTSHRQPRFRRFFSGDGLFSCPFANRHETV